jgi:hypothetical protein
MIETLVAGDETIYLASFRRYRFSKGMVVYDYRVGYPLADCLIANYVTE